MTTMSGMSDNVPMTVKSLNCPLYSMMPFTQYDKLPRSILGGIQFTQATSREPTGYSNSSSRSTQWALPYLMGNTRTAEQLCLSSMVERRSMPGVLVAILYHNHPMCHEDALVVNARSVKRGMFDVMSCPKYVVDNSSLVPSVGDTIAQEDQVWWKVPHVGTVTNVRSDRFNTWVWASFKSRPMSGDKLSTPHGQKGVAVIVDDMPCGIDIVTGRHVEFDVCSSAVSIITRISPGQVMEGQQDRHGNGLGYGVCNDVLGGAAVMSTPDTSRPVEASYGTVLMWPLYHRTVDKTHYTHAPPSRMDYQVKRGRSTGGGLRSSEMELLSMMCSRSTSVVSEILENTDMCITPVCTKCKRVGMCCIHNTDEHFVAVRVPYSTLVLNETLATAYNRVLMLDLEPVVKESDVVRLKDGGNRDGSHNVSMRRYARGETQTGSPISMWGSHLSSGRREKHTTRITVVLAFW
jgi:hypothetical protein